MSRLGTILFAWLLVPTQSSACMLNPDPVERAAAQIDSYKQQRDYLRSVGEEATAVVIAVASTVEPSSNSQFQQASFRVVDVLIGDAEEQPSYRWDASRIVVGCGPNFFYDVHVVAGQRYLLAVRGQVLLHARILEEGQGLVKLEEAQAILVAAHYPEFQPPPSDQLGADR
jgi:hypothetical protein